MYILRTYIFVKTYKQASETNDHFKFTKGWLDLSQMVKAVRNFTRTGPWEKSGQTLDNITCYLILPILLLFLWQFESQIIIIIVIIITKIVVQRLLSVAVYIYLPEWNTHIVKEWHALLLKCTS